MGSRKKWIIIAACVLGLALAGGAGALALRDSGEPGGAAREGATPAQTSAAAPVSGTGPGAARPTSGSVVATANVSQKVMGNPGSGTGPGPKPTGAPKTAGPKPLELVERAPGGAVAFLQPAGYEEGAAYRVRFQAFGKTPGTNGSQQAILWVSTVEPLDPGSKVPEIANRHVLVTVRADLLAVLFEQGHYRGTIVLERQGGLMGLALKSAQAVSQ